MTPHSTDRAHAISPLDIFGPAAPAAPHAQTLDPAQRFEHVLKKASAPAKNAPQSKREAAADVRSRSPDRVDNEAHAARRSESGRSKHRPGEATAANTPAKQDTEKLRDESKDDKSDDSATSDVSVLPSQPVAESSQPDPASEEAELAALEIGSWCGTSEVMGDSAKSGNSVTMADESEAAAEEATNAASQESTPGTDTPAIQFLHADENLLATSDDASALPDIEAPLPGQPEETIAEANSTSVDRIAGIDAQTAAGELTSEHDQDNIQESGESNQNGEAPDPSAPLSPAAEVPQDFAKPNSAHVPPVASGDAPAAPKENAPTSSPNTNSAASTPTSASRLPQHVLARTESHRGHNPAPVPIDSARFLSRVAKAFQSAQQRDGEVRLRLSPPELGSLRLQVSVQDGVMVARMETETEAARSSLVNNLPQLRDRLAEQGIRVERFDIDLMQRPSTGTPDRPSDPQQQPEPQPLRTLRPQTASPESSSPSSTVSNWNGNGRLNIIV